MPRLLIYRPEFDLVAADLAAYGTALECLVMETDCTVTLDGAAIDAGAVSPEIAWLSGALWLTPAARPFMGAMVAAPALKWVQSAAAGFDNAAFRRIVANGARLTTSHGQAVGMSDYVIAGVLDVFQRGADRRAAQDAKVWRSLPFREVKDSTWLIVGLGAVGQGVAIRARGFGARIVGVRRNQAPDPLADAIAPLAALGEHLPSADVVVLCAPLSEATRHLANAAFFGAMRAGSVLVNVGRGALVDESALLAALDRGTPAHAVLDVFETEPLPAESPLWAHPRVSVTAHSSGVTGAQDARNRSLFLENLALYLAHKPLLNEADPKDVLAAG